MEFKNKYIIRLMTLCFFMIFNLFIAADTKNTDDDEIPQVEENHVLIKINTTMGTMYADLDPTKDPITVKHFLKLVDQEFYQNIVFHRVIEGFIIQAGKYDQHFKPKSVKIHPLKNQSKQTHLENTYATLAMARIASDPDSATSEFFINLSNNPSLNSNEKKYGYAVFGKVVKGMDVAHKIASIKTWEKDDLLYAPFFPNEALIKDITRVSNLTEK